MTEWQDKQVHKGASLLKTQDSWPIEKHEFGTWKLKLSLKLETLAIDASYSYILKNSCYATKYLPTSTDSRQSRDKNSAGCR